MMDVVDFAVKVTAAVLRRLADGIDTAEKPPAAPPPMQFHIHIKDGEDMEQVQDRIRKMQQVLRFRR